MMIVGVVVLAVGVLCLLMVVPLAHEQAIAGSLSVGWAIALGSLAVDSKTMGKAAPASPALAALLSKTAKLNPLPI
jgi:hypothetical protein